MRTILLAVIATATATFIGSSQLLAAGELDRETTITTEQAHLAKNLPTTLVVRVKADTKQVEVLHTKKALAPTEANKSLVAQGKFAKMDVRSKVSGELDRDSSSSSWYFFFPTYNYYYPTYYYYGYSYNYTPYCNYYYGGYNYYYYRWNWRY